MELRPLPRKFVDPTLRLSEVLSNKLLNSRLDESTLTDQQKLSIRNTLEILGEKGITVSALRGLLTKSQDFLHEDQETRVNLDKLFLEQNTRSMGKGK